MTSAPLPPQQQTAARVDAASLADFCNACSSAAADLVVVSGYAVPILEWVTNALTTRTLPLHAAQAFLCRLITALAAARAGSGAGSSVGAGSSSFSHPFARALVSLVGTLQTRVDSTSTSAAGGSGSSSSVLPADSSSAVRCALDVILADALRSGRGSERAARSTLAALAHE